MSKQKIFTTKEEIVKAIDATKERAFTLSQRAEVEEAKIKECIAAAAKEPTQQNWWAEQIANHRSNAKKARRSSHLCMESKLPRLKRTLAAFETEVFPGGAIVPDRRVVMQA